MEISEDTDKKSEELMFEFVGKHLQANPKMLYLRIADKNLGFSAKEACIQIECRQAARRKIALFLTKSHFRFACREVAEQATHQCVAAYHAELIGRGKKVLDLTAGLGIDSFTAALGGNHVTGFELDHERFEALEHNAALFTEDISKARGSLNLIEGDSIRWLSEHKPRPDVIFVDPARRDEDSRRIIRLADCAPDAVANNAILASTGAVRMIKTSPLLDLKAILSEIPDVAELHIVCVKGECKEVLIIAGAGEREKADILIKVLDLADREDGRVERISEWECRAQDLDSKPRIFSESGIPAGSYIYDPNAGIHKARAAGKLCGDFPEISKISANTDLYVSREYYPEFPGRTFRVDKEVDKTDLKKLKGERLEVISRNYPLAANQFRLKYGLASGSDIFLICFRTGPEEIPSVYLTTRIK